MRGPVSSSKPYIGVVTDRSFEVRKNSAVFATTFYIVGDYEADGEITQVYFGLKRSRFEYYALRIMPFFMIMVVTVALYNSVTVLRLLGINLLLVASFTILILLDNYFGKRMAQDFIEKMKITL
jgi:hypothetical protein